MQVTPHTAAPCAPMRPGLGMYMSIQIIPFAAKESGLFLYDLKLINSMLIELQSQEVSPNTHK